MTDTVCVCVCVCVYVRVRERERDRVVNIDLVGCEEAFYPSVFQTLRQTTVSVTLTPPAADELLAAQETLSYCS